MRRSRYTVAMDAPDGGHLLFNTALGTFAELDDDAMACFESCEGPFAHLLEDAGFITTLTAEEELQLQDDLFHAGCADNGELVLVLAPTYACNLRCPYCYEQGHNGVKGKMSQKVMDDICTFVSKRQGETGFNKLSVQWYGGDPSLALDVVEELSERLIRWSDDHGVEYSAMMLSNCNLIDEEAVRMLVDARVEGVYITIDGFEETHNVRRKSAVGLNSYQKNIEAARLFKKYGISVKAGMNVDKVNWPEYHDLRDMLYDEFGIELMFARLCDYGHFFGTRDFKKPEFDLFEHDEYSRLCHDEFSTSAFNEERLKDMLSAVPRFCNGQRHNYFVIDTIGDAYLCDGYIGEHEHVVFNVADEPTQEQLKMLSHDPYESEQCRACHLLPICQGNCDWERRATGMHCHPFLTTLPDYLRDYRSCFGDADAPFTRFV